MSYDGELFLQSVLSEFADDRRVRRYGGCWVCAYVAAWPSQRRMCEYVSHPRLDAHHLLPKQVLRRELPEEDVERALLDPRNGIPVRRYHHDALEQRQICVPLARLPREAVAFAEELGLRHHLERLHPA